MSAPDPELAGFGTPLLAAARTLRKPAGAVLFRAGQRPAWMYYVRAGEAVMQRVTATGSPVILQRASGGFLAEASLTSGRYHCEGACRTACELLAFPLAALRSAIDTEPAVRWAWIERLGAETRRQRARIERASLRTIRERLAHLIHAEGAGRDGYMGPATRIQLAAELGVRPEALYRCLRDLQDEGVLAIEGRRLVWLGS